MVASAIYILDVKGKPLISRNYIGDIPPTAIDKFMPLLIESEESYNQNGSSGYAPPVLTEEGISYLFIKHNNLYRKNLTCS
jgi:AP-1 complex subunit mu